jgi:hypothetical protein
MERLLLQFSHLIASCLVFDVLIALVGVIKVDSTRAVLAPANSWGMRLIYIQNGVRIRTKSMAEREQEQQKMVRSAIARSGWGLVCSREGWGLESEVSENDVERSKSGNGCSFRTTDWDNCSRGLWKWTPQFNGHSRSEYSALRMESNGCSAQRLLPCPQCFAFCRNFVQAHCYSIIVQAAS